MTEIIAEAKKKRSIFSFSREERNHVKDEQGKEFTDTATDRNTFMTFSSNLEGLKLMLNLPKERRLKSVSSSSNTTASTIFSSTSSSCKLTSSNRSLPSPGHFRSPPKSCMVVETQDESLSRRYSQTRTLSNETEQAVHFTDVEFYFHGITLGDNPAVSEGPPLTIEWEAFYSPGAIKTDEWEQSNTDRKPRLGKELMIPSKIRWEWLRNAGFTKSQIEEREKECKSIRRSRGNAQLSQEDIIPTRQKKCVWRKLRQIF